MRKYLYEQIHRLKMATNFNGYADWFNMIIEENNEHIRNSVEEALYQDLFLDTDPDITEDPEAFAADFHTHDSLFVHGNYDPSDPDLPF